MRFCNMFKELALKRRSIRRFGEKDVPDNALLEILDTATLAPSAGNLQAWDLVIVRDAGTREKLALAAYSQGFIAEAPIVVVVCANRQRSGRKYGKRGEDFYSIIDASILASYIQLAAADTGLSTVWVGAFDNGSVRKILSLPSFAEPVAILPIGYPAEKGHEKDRLPLEKVLHKEKW